MAKAEDFLYRGRVARLATVDSSGRPLVLPICYAFDGGSLFTPLDEKPKSVAPRQLKRVRNILSNPHVAVVVDHYSEDWSQLGYVIVNGEADVLEAGEEHSRAVALLREKYPQYRSMNLEQRPIIRIRVTKIVTWGRLE